MKRTKTKLVSSIVTLLICFAMLIGSTFAWFTDSASTGVNKIQAGNLDVVLEMKDSNGNWVNAEGKTLEFKKAVDAPANEPILWEPGCTYKLPELRIVNKGNLNLKYKIEITGIQGDAKLNEVIDWTINGAAINLTEEYLSAGQTGTAFTIKGHMQETAGNEYKNLTIDGISITVYATQDTGEFDSITDDYDSGAQYVERTATIMGADGKTITLESGKTYTVGDATVTVDANGNIEYVNASSNPQTVSITTDGGALTVNAPNATVNHYGESEYVVINAIAGNSFHEFGKVGILSVESGRVVAENGNNIDIIQVKGNSAVVAVPENVVLETKLENADGITSFTIQKGNDANNRINVTIENNDTTVADGVVVPKELENVIGNDMISNSRDYVARIGNEYYETLDGAISAAKSGDTVVLLKDSVGMGIGSKDGTKVRDSLTIDFNGYTYTMNDPAVGSTGTKSQAMHWGGSLGAVTLKNGTFKVAKGTTSVKMAMQNYINFIAENMSFDFTTIPVYKYGDNQYTGANAVYNGLEIPMFNNGNSGTMTLKNSTVYMPENSTKGIDNYGNDLIIESSTINGAVVIEYENSTVKVKDSVITKGVSPYFNSGYTVKASEADYGYTVYTNHAVVDISSTEDLNKAISAANKGDTFNFNVTNDVTLDNGIANGDKSLDITFIGDGSQTVDVVEKAINAEGGMLNYQRGSSFTFENLTIQAGEGNFDGIVCNELTFKNCTIKGKLTLFGKATFINCVFDNTMANQYSIWTWGGTDVKFEDCTFNTNGKAILLYGGASGSNPTNLVVNNCTFNDRNSGAAEKAAIEIGNDYNATYTLTVNKATVNGFAEGKNTGSKLWANKNSMDAAHLTVTIDGSQVQ